MVDVNPSVAVSIFLSIIMSDDEFAVAEAAILGLDLGANWLLSNGFITLNWTYKVVLDTPLYINKVNRFGYRIKYCYSCPISEEPTTCGAWVNNLSVTYPTILDSMSMSANHDIILS